MPIDSGGSYRMTQGGADMHSAALDNATDGAPQTYTLTKQPDGSWQCSDGMGSAPSTHPSLDDALAYVKNTAEGTSENPAQDQGQAQDTSDSSTADDSY